MELTVPTNWQDDLIPALAGLNVAELYGQLPRDFVGGGRAPSLIGNVSKRQVRRHVAQATKAGIRFNYLLNATTMANREWSLSGQSSLERLLDFIIDAGVGTVTVGIPYLLEFIKRRAPFLEVSVSTQAMVASPERAQRWQDLGADSITLSVLDVNRDFRRLREIREAVTMRLQLIGNLQCLQGCPAGIYHGALNAHASQTGMSRFVMDYCTVECNHRRFAHPEEFIKAGWIRPEDQHYYAEIGIDRIKLVTRGMRTDALVPIVRAYSEGRSPDNLMDIFPSPDKSIIYGGRRLWTLIQNFAHPHKVNVFRLPKLKTMADSRRMFIDSKTLDGFLTPFLQGRCNPAKCDTCGHCAAIAERAIRFEDGYRETAEESHARVMDEILSGRLFRYFGRGRGRRQQANKSEQ